MPRYTITNDQVFASLQAMNLIGEKEPDGQLGLKCARIAKRLRDEAILIQGARQVVMKKYARRWPDGPQAGEPMPKFRAGTPPEQRTIDNVQAMVPNEYDLGDNEAITREELKELGAGECDLDILQLSEKEIGKLGLKPNVIEPLLWNIDGPPDVPAGE